MDQLADICPDLRCPPPESPVLDRSDVTAAETKEAVDLIAGYDDAGAA
jgi:hypothetical protein